MKTLSAMNGSRAGGEAQAGNFRQISSVRYVHSCSSFD